MSSLYLCGFMGCGKSTLGQMLSLRMDLPLIDLDDYITVSQGCSISNIFHTQGEAAFRQMETEALRALTQIQPNAIISCGGGTMIQPQNAALAKQNGKIIFLDAPFSLCYERIRGDENRPLAAKRDEAELLALYEARRPVYTANATHVIPVIAQDTPQQITERILTL